MSINKDHSNKNISESKCKVEYSNIVMNKHHELANTLYNKGDRDNEVTTGVNSDTLIQKEIDNKTETKYLPMENEIDIENFAMQVQQGINKITEHSSKVPHTNKTGHKECDNIMNPKKNFEGNTNINNAISENRKSDHITTTKHDSTGTSENSIHTEPDGITVNDGLIIEL